MTSIFKPLGSPFTSSIEPTFVSDVTVPDIALPSNPDLLCYYDMDGIITSTLEDRSLAGNNGFITGASAVEGKIGDALAFDKTTFEHVQVSSALPSTISTPISISLWVRLDLGRAAGGCIFAYRDSTNSLIQIFDQLTDIRLQIRGSGGGSVQTITTSAPAGDTWYHVVANIDPTGTRELFLDTVSQGTNSAALSGTLSSSASYIGTYSNGLPLATANQVNGRVDLFRIYNRLLTTQEVSELNNSGAGI